MRKIFAAAIIVLASLVVGYAQQAGSIGNTSADGSNMGVAPTQANGIGRADVRVFDGSGHPVQNARIKLVSKRSDGFICEGWGSTNAAGRLVVPPLHMGDVTIDVKAKGFQSQLIHIRNSDLAQPVVVNLVH